VKRISFSWVVVMSMEFECEASLYPNRHYRVNTFSSLASGFIGGGNAWQAFFQFFEPWIRWDRTDFYVLQKGTDSDANGNNAVISFR
jgi:hypothetical protein